MEMDSKAEILDRIKTLEGEAITFWVVQLSLTAIGIFVSCVVMVMLMCMSDEPPQPRPKRLKNETEDTEMQCSSAAMDMEV